MDRKQKLEVKTLGPSTKHAKKAKFWTTILKRQFWIAINCFGNNLVSLSTMELIFSACVVELCNQWNLMQFLST